MEPCISSEDVKKLLTRIVADSNVFYRHQKKDEPDFTIEEKFEILSDLFSVKPSLFLQRYHRYLDERDMDFFLDNPTNQIYFELIKKRKSEPQKHKALRNKRFLAMQKLIHEGVYFSLDKMRERDPDLFNLMLGDHLKDDEKATLRPTEELKDGADYTDYMGEYEQCCSEETLARRKRHVEEFEKVIKCDTMDRFMHHVEQHEDDEFEVEFDSDDDEGRNAEIERQARLLKQRQDRQVEDKFQSEARTKEENESTTIHKMSELDVTDRNESTAVSRNSSEDLEHDRRLEEFVSMMEERFLEGGDTEFYDYDKVEESEEYLKLREQDEEDAYFDCD